MTYKYERIRREIFEKDPARKLKRNHTFFETLKIVKWEYWVSSILVIVLSLVAMLLANNFYLSILALGFAVILILICSGMKETEMYHFPERDKQIVKNESERHDYVNEISKLLVENDITDKVTFSTLKKECEQMNKKYEQKFSLANAKLSEMLLIVPVSAIIAGFIYPDRTPDQQAVSFFIALGIILYGILKGQKLLSYYSDGYFKDKYLLDALNELEYEHFGNTT